jgi:hypothetical protein
VRRGGFLSSKQKRVTLYYGDITVRTWQPQSVFPLIRDRHWLSFPCSPQAGPKVAALLSVVETCRRLGIPARKYLNAVLPGLADVRISQLAGLTPAAWAARNR